MWEATNPRWWRVVQAHIRERLQEDGILQEQSQRSANLTRRTHNNIAIPLESLQNSVASNPSEEEDDIASVEIEEEFSPDNHDLDSLFNDVVDDMNFLTGLLSRIYRRFYSDHLASEPDTQKDDKLQQLLNLLKKHPDEKVLIFTEFCDTARYLYTQLRNSGFGQLAQIDSRRKVNREDIIVRFSPCYNEQNLQAVAPVQTLITTDVLAEGLNLQDASIIINYDLHWNPVRLMQRIGRLDRRLDPDIEDQLNRTDPTVRVWNFLPPEELDDLLNLRRRIDGKILRISRTLGIEGKFVSPDDPEETIRLFNEQYDGTESIEELMNLERQRIAESEPDLWSQLSKLPLRLFSGKRASDEPTPFRNREDELIPLERAGATGIFCCYQMPNDEVRWYFYNIATDEVFDNVEQIWTEIRCEVATPRYTESGQGGLGNTRKKIERFIRSSYLRSIQAPIGSNPKLLAWMEVS